MSGPQSSRNCNLMIGQPGAEQNGGWRAEAGKSTGSNASSRSSSSSNGTDASNDGSHRLSRLRPLARLDRLLRRWLPGYNYLRGLGANASHSSNDADSPTTSSLTSPGRASEQQQEEQEQQLEDQMRAAVQMPHGSDVSPNRRRRNGEIVLNAGIAKSEFCQKLEKLLRAKLIVKN